MIFWNAVSVTESRRDAVTGGRGRGSRDVPLNWPTARVWRGNGWRSGDHERMRERQGIGNQGGGWGAMKSALPSVFFGEGWRSLPVALARAGRPAQLARDWAGGQTQGRPARGQGGPQQERRLGRASRYGGGCASLDGSPCQWGHLAHWFFTTTTTTTQPPDGWVCSLARV